MKLDLHILTLTFEIIAVKIGICLCGIHKPRTNI